MIIEGLMTTVCDDGTVNLSPMGPLVDPSLTRFHLRPYQSSRTFKNLVSRGEAVFHVTDDVDLIARAAVGQVEPFPEVKGAVEVDGWVVQRACRWYELRVVTLDDSRDRAEIQCELVAQGRLRDFFGFNRAKHAVLEAAILATRVGFLPVETILADMQRLESSVSKTAGDQEQAAFEFLDRYIREALMKGSG